MSPAPDTIRVVDGLGQATYTYYPILIVGAGESAIALASRLREEGFDQFRLFERQSGIGGTWWINRYPGVACDVLHPEGPEIYKYLSDICEKYQFVDKIQVNTDVSELRWLEDEQIWEATLTHMVPGTGDISSRERNQRIAENGMESVYLRQEVVRARIVCSCAGGLVEPNVWPSSIPGRDTFEGPVFHSARWDYNVDLNNKDVIVIGTGCSAAQFVPRLTEEPYNAKSVTQIMRSPPWVVPRPEEPFGPENYRKYSPMVFSTVPGLAALFRFICFARGESDWFRLFDDNSWNQKSRKKLESQMIARMKRMVPEKYHEILTPNYSIGCKRRIFDKAWFQSLNNPKIELTTKPITNVAPNSITIGPGRHYPDPHDKKSKVPTNEETIPADVIILGNGFEVTTWLHPLKIRGKNGEYMQEVWDARGGPQAYLGLAMDGFPNLFIIFGPNTATGHSSVVLASENMVEYSIKVIKKILRGDITTAEIKKESEVAWTKTVQERLKRTVFNSGCHNWYQTDGWNATGYPYSQIDFTFRCMFPKWSDWDLQYTRKGLIRKRAGQALNVLLLVLALVGAYFLRRESPSDSLSLQSLTHFVQKGLKQSLYGISGMVNRAITMLPEPWVPPAFHTSDDRVRGGSSQSSLSALPQNCALFHGHLDIDTLGGAGFASQFQSAASSQGEEGDGVWDLSAYAGVEIDVGAIDGKIYTLVLKDEEPQDRRNDGRDRAGVSWEAEFCVTESDEGDTVDEAKGKKIWVSWSALKATYRGKEKKDAGKLKTDQVKRVGFMMRRSISYFGRYEHIDRNVYSYFGTQQGDFRLELRSLSAREKPSANGQVLSV
ncbi:MAG: hypothetical protein Q9170_002289 [Blastenia crenularia]